MLVEESMHIAFDESNQTCKNVQSGVEDDDLSEDRYSTKLQYEPEKVAQLQEIQSTVPTTHSLESRVAA